MKNVLLAASQLKGGIAVIVIFLLCFIVVHAVKLSSIGYKTFERETKPNDDTVKHKKRKRSPKRIKKTSIPAPVYYLVERKTAPPEREEQFDKPKRIQFQE